MVRWLWWGLPLALGAALYAPTLTSGFLADDYTYLVSLAWWAESGEMASRVLANFGAGIDAPSHYYRPLPIASFALNFVAGGADPLGWRAVNVALHIGCGALIAALTTGLAARPDARAAFGAATAAGIFVLSPAGPEVAAWVSGRFDALALFFMLLALVCCARSARWNDRYGVAGLVAGALAFASKESATLLPVLALALALGRPEPSPTATAGGAHALATVVTATRRALPWFLLLAAYFIGRIAIFGSPFRVYPGAEPLAALVGGDWLTTLASSASWLRAELPDPVARSVFGGALAVTVGFGAAWCLAHRAYRLRWLALAGAVAVAIVLPLLQVHAFDPEGEGGRLFYVAAAALGMLVALPYASADPGAAWMWNRGVRSLFVSATVATLLAEAVLLDAALQNWRTAGAQAKQLVAQLARLPARIPANGYGFVLVPDRIGGVPFGRLAQGGFTLPPVQPEPLLSRLVVQTERDLPAWPENIRRGVIDALKRYPAQEVWPAVAAGRVTPGGVPTDYFCWDTAHARLVALALPTPSAGEHWLPAWKKALAESACETLAQVVPER